MGKSLGKNICQNASGKNSQKHPDHAKQPATDARKTASKTAKAIGDLIGNNNADKITKVWKTSQQNNSETVTNERDKEMSKERHIFGKERQKITNELRLI